jgi:DNA-binding XRE family transcriptional regulator
MNVSIRVTSSLLTNLGKLVAIRAIPGFPPDERFTGCSPCRTNTRQLALVDVSGLKKHREAARLSQGQLSKLSNVTISTISSIETGHIKKTNKNRAARLAEALGISFAELTEEVKK